nr:hypothetical protein [Rhodovulum robiginosum]
MIELALGDCLGDLAFDEPLQGSGHVVSNSFRAGAAGPVAGARQAVLTGRSYHSFGRVWRSSPVP